MRRTIAGLSLIFILVLMIITGVSAGCVDVSSPVKESYWENSTVSENHSETYSELVPITRTVSGEQALTPYIVWSVAELGFNTLKHIWYYGYSLPRHDESRVQIFFLKQSYYEFVRVYVYDFGERGQILAPPLVSTTENISSSAVGLQGIGSWNTWIASADTKLALAHPLAGISDLWLNYDGNRTVEFDTHGSREIGIIISGPSIAQNCHFTTSLSWSDYTTENATRTTDHIVTSSIQQPTLQTRNTFETRKVPFWEILFNH
ncbi:MAG: hypothetical protein ABSG90_08205 [Dehalococcoidia bacterium]|jgi:hypothetical protein